VAIHYRELEALNLPTGCAGDVLNKDYAAIKGLITRQPLSGKQIYVLSRDLIAETKLLLSDHIGTRYLVDSVCAKGANNTNVHNFGMLKKASFEFCRCYLPPVITLVYCSGRTGFHTL